MSKKTILWYYIIIIAVSLVIVLSKPNVETVQEVKMDQTTNGMKLPKNPATEADVSELEIQLERMKRRHADLRIEAIEFERELEKQQKVLQETKAEVSDQFDLESKQSLASQLSSKKKSCLDIQEEIKQFQKSIKQLNLELDELYSNLAKRKSALDKLIREGDKK